MEINRESIKEILKTTGVVANKNLGQNFLVDTEISKRITQLLNVDKTDRVLEIGPGLGSLTHFLSDYNLDVVDIDKRMCDILKAIYCDKENINIINNDILKHDVGNYDKIVSNLPYYITSDIISYLLLNAKKCKQMVFMVQKEAALRFLDANDTSEPLSILINMLGTIKKEFIVKPSSFTPMPHVDSLVFSIEINHYFDDIKNIYRFVKTMYLQKRKTIYNNLSSYTRDKGKSEEILALLNLDKNLRPENLKKDDYLRMYELIKNRG